MIFDNVEKDALYYAIKSCSEDYAEKNGKDKLAEDVVLFYDLIENVTCIQLTEIIVDKLNENGYEIKRKEN